MYRTTQRQYSPRALELWLDRVVHPWESLFSPEELHRARELYREGEVRSLELSDTLAIFHGGRMRDDVYALVEWNDGQFEIRFSIPDRSAGRALAAAGLYEIEELLADEVNPLPIEAKADSKTDADEGRRVEVKRAAPADLSPIRPLVLELSIDDRGLCCQGFWKNPNGATENAFGSKASGGTEREDLIFVTSRARRCGFSPNDRHTAYFLRDPRRMVEFVRKELPRWRKRFKTEIDPEVHRIGEGVKIVDLNLSIDDLGDGVRLKWEGRHRGEDLVDVDFSRLLRGPREAVFAPGHGLLRLEEAAARQVSEWRPLLQGSDSVALPRYLIFSLQSQDAVRIRLSSELQRWHETVSGGDDLMLSELPGFLRDYQLRGVRWMQRLCRVGCHPLLADEMGLGKTVQILSLISADLLERPRPSIIVCPASVVPVWQAEADRFFPGMRLRVLSQRNVFGDDGEEEPDLWIASYTQLRRHKSLLAESRFRFAVLDEAQFIKNPDAKVTHACLSINAEHRLALTGTPLENRQLDLWTIFRFLMPGLLGSRGQFEDMVQSEGEAAVGDRLRRQIGPFILRRTKRDVAEDLPPKVEIALTCPMSEVQLNEYRKLVEYGSKTFGEDVRGAIQKQAITFFSLLTRLRQVCCDPGLLPWRSDDPSQSGKLTTLVERMNELLASGHKVVVFSQFVQLLQRLDGMLDREYPKVPRFMLTGATTDRAKPVRSFQNLKGAGIFLVSLKAGGTGITLHAADYVFLLDPWWNPAVESQAIDRVHRIGQTRRVFVYRLVTKGTIEARIEGLKSHKRDLFDRLVEGLEEAADWPSQFGQLSELIEYREDGDAYIVPDRAM